MPKPRPTKATISSVRRQGGDHTGPQQTRKRLSDQKIVQEKSATIKKYWTDGGWSTGQLARLYGVPERCVAKLVGQHGRNPGYWGIYI